MNPYIKKLHKLGRKISDTFDPDGSHYQSQAGQDRFVLNSIYKKKKRNGFFLEMGAADGVLLSNTYVFEKRYGWKGILVEPSHRFVPLQRNRDAICVRACIGDSSKGIFLLELPGGLYLNKDESNTLRSVAIAADSREEAMEKVPAILAHENIKPEPGKEFPLIEVEAISLTELLDQNGAPPVIDYFSLDVEGHEDAVFRGFDFSKYRFNIMNVEEPSEWLQKLLIENGYVEITRNAVEDVFYRHESFSY